MGLIMTNFDFKLNVCSAFSGGFLKFAFSDKFYLILALKKWPKILEVVNYLLILHFENG